MQLSAYDLNQLLILDALLETGSVNGAAARVGLSPSAVSHALRRCRQTFGDPLLVRAGQRLAPTPRAESLLPLVRDVLTRAERLFAKPELDLLTLTRTARLAVTDHGELTIGRPLSTYLLQVAPRVDLRMLPYGDRLFGALREGEVDLAVGVFPPLPVDILSQPIRQERFVCLLRKGHSAARAKRLTLDRYVALEHIIVSQSGASCGLVDKRLEALRLSRRVARTVTSYLIAPLLVAESDLIVTIAESVVGALGTKLPLVERRPPLDLEGFTLQMIWHRRTDEDPFQAWLRQAVHQVARPTEPSTRAGRASAAPRPAALRP